VLVALVAMIGAFTLGGCAKFYWTKPGSTAEQFNADSAVCIKEATVVPAAASDIEQQTYRECLEKRGYVRQELYAPSADSHRGVEGWSRINRSIR
jgi:hypothetical protein